MSAGALSLADLRSAFLDLSDTVATPPVSTGELSGHPADSFTVSVMGVSGGAGATTVALAVAEALDAARLYELASVFASGLASASSRELGVRGGWNLGVRSDLVVARRVDPDTAIDTVAGVVVLDAGPWTEALADTTGVLVVVAPCSVPGIRRLDAILQERDPSCVIPVLTRVPGKVPRAVLGAASPLLRAVLGHRRVHLFPECRDLAISGVTAEPLPRLLQRSAAAVALHVKELSCSLSR